MIGSALSSVHGMRTRRMDPAEVQRLMRLNRIIYPYASRQYEALGDRRMVHYTTAENAYRIVASKTMWMRDTNTMVDYSEVVFGTELLNQFFRQETQRNAFLEAMGLCYPGVGDEVLKQFDAWFPATRFATYVACISE